MFGYGKQYHEIRNLKKDILLGDSGWVVILHDLGGQNKQAYAIEAFNADKYYKQGSTVITDDFIPIPRIRNEFRRELLWDLSKIL